MCHGHLCQETEDKVYKKITTYKICARSGSLGPNVIKETYKSRKVSTTSTTLIPQVTIISLMINYPNHSDLKKQSLPPRRQYLHSWKLRNGRLSSHDRRQDQGNIHLCHTSPSIRSERYPCTSFLLNSRTKRIKITAKPIVPILTY